MRLPPLPSDAPLERHQLEWLSGFLGALGLRPEPAGARERRAGASRTGREVRVYYGSETGNAEFLAEDLAAAITGLGARGTASGLDRLTPEALAEIRSPVLFTISTTGEGDMPYNAEDFWWELSSEAAPRLPSLEYGVLALGDRAYDAFCDAGRLLDERLAELGARRIVDRADCDVYYERQAAGWIAAAAEISVEAAERDGTAADALDVPSRAPRAEGRGRPSGGPPAEVAAVLRGKRILSDAGGERELVHYELDVEDAGYEPGDRLAVHAPNEPRLVEAVLDLLDVGGEERSDVAETLTTGKDIRLLPVALVRRLAEAASDDALLSLLDEDPAAAAARLDGTDLLSLLRRSPRSSITPGELLPLLLPLAPRSYSISSSPLAHPGQAHLLTRTVRYRRDGRTLRGTATGFLAERVEEGAGVRATIGSGRSFRLPPDDAPIVMIGPGVGVAPFRAFLEHRRERGATGMSWLFFGGRRPEDDFPYADDFSRLARDGVLTRMDTSFSRTGRPARYVQHRMLENAGALASWLLDDGATVYVCGDAHAMAPDVDRALRQILGRALGSAARGDTALEGLAAQGRYLRDVY